jgi:hypothetical protein
MRKLHKHNGPRVNPYFSIINPEVERLTAKAEALRKSEAYAEPLPREEIVYSLRQVVDSYYEFAENGRVTC